MQCSPPLFRITFQRGKQLAEQNGIADVLYPLFEPNIQSFLYHPDNYPRTAAVMAAAQERQAARKSGGMPGQGPASGLDMGGGPPATSMVGSSSQDADYPGGQASWNTPHHAQQQHHYRPVGNGANYISSAPGTAAHSPAHHTHSGYNTPGGGLMQSHGSQQAGTPMSNHGSVMRSSLGSNNGAIPNDRRHSNQLDVTGGGGGNSMDHPGHSSNPYALSSNHSSMDNGLPSSASSSNNSNGPPTAGTLQSLPGIGSVGQRRTLSSTSYKRGYGDEDGSAPGGPNGSSSYESGGGGPSGDFYSQGGPGSERSYKRPRESGIARGSGMKHEGQDEASYDTSGEYGTANPGNGIGSAGPGSINGDKRGSGP
jgi:protein SOK2